MSYNTPYQQKLQPDSYHDADEIAAGWRLMAAQVKGKRAALYKDLEDTAAKLNGFYKAYLKAANKEKLQRFDLKLFVDSAVDESGLLAYHSTLALVATKEVFRSTQIYLTHLESQFGVSAEVMAGIIGGSLLLEGDIHEVVAAEITGQIGGTQIITEIPGPSLAGQYQPNYFQKKANGGNYQMAFRRRYT